MLAKQPTEDGKEGAIGTPITHERVPQLPHAPSSSGKGRRLCKSGRSRTRRGLGLVLRLPFELTVKGGGASSAATGLRYASRRPFETTLGLSVARTRQVSGRQLKTTFGNCW